MINQFFQQKAANNLPFELTLQQKAALSNTADFLFSKEQETIFLLTGYAGTGKSSLIGALVKTMDEMKQKVVLLAPTGRAAKVFSFYANHPTFTIHKKIYRQKAYTGSDAEFAMMENLHTNTLFIVDEASMIYNDTYGKVLFGTGRLLDDLIKYVYAGENCRLMLIGDAAQLSPIGQDESPALNIGKLQSYGLNVFTSNLTEIVRQSESSGIVFNATTIREALRLEQTELYPKIRFEKFDDIISLKGEDLIEEMASVYHRDGVDCTMVITRSNKRANIYNQGIRNRVLYKEEELASGDLLMITKNNYFWAESIEGLDFLANGEIVEVKRVRNIQEIFGFRFCDVELKSKDHDIEFSAKLLLDSLYSESANLSREEEERLFTNIMQDYEHITSKSSKIKELKKDKYFNAIQAKFAYAVTCHKAQGGEWDTIFIDIGYITEDHLGTNFYRWLYTAITRASQKLYFVNLPKEFL